VKDDDIEPWRWFLRAHAAALSAIEADMAARKAIPLSWYDVLLELNAAEGRQLRMTDLAERVVLSRTRVSRVVDELVAEGLVERTKNPADARSALATLTKAGRSALRSAAPHYLAGIRTHFLDLLAPDEREVIANALRRVALHHKDAAARRRSGR